MLHEFEAMEEFSVPSEIADTTVRVRSRLQVNYKPAGSVRVRFGLTYTLVAYTRAALGVDEQFAHEAAAQVLRKHVKGIPPSVH